MMFTKEQLVATNGKRFTQALFWEVEFDENVALFSVAINPKEGLVDFKKLYLSYAVDDPSEYTFAMEVFGNWEQWEKIKTNRKITPHLESIFKERDIALKSKMLTSIVKEAVDGRAKLAAAKYIIEEGYTKRHKSDKSLETAKEAYKRVHTESEEDFRRIGLEH